MVLSLAQLTHEPKNDGSPYEIALSFDEHYYRQSCTQNAGEGVTYNTDRNTPWCENTCIYPPPYVPVLEMQFFIDDLLHVKATNDAPSAVVPDTCTR